MSFKAPREKLVGLSGGRVWGDEHPDEPPDVRSYRYQKKRGLIPRSPRAAENNRRNLQRLNPVLNRQLRYQRRKRVFWVVKGDTARTDIARIELRMTDKF